ncbi:MAG: ribosome small subunit-dependent GTPase A [Bacteroidales bacterium]|nr:ribosome small subunit-dependent GTPase A [Bacteroidales bacterium]
MTGLVVKNTGSDYCVLADGDKLLYVCKVKGNFRIKGIKSTNPIAIGDRVEFNAEGYIVKLLERKNYLVRKPTNLSKQLHILAANIDQALLLVTVKYPETDITFIDRFLASAEAYAIPAKLVFNKIDLLDDADKTYLDALVTLYQSIGYECLCMSAQNGDGVEEVRQLCKEKISLLSGNSGVGKSTLINTLIPNAQAHVGNISQSHLKGMHTTTFSEMYIGNDNMYLIDTPGIKGFGTVDFKEEEVSHYFPEIFKISKNCKYHNCTHRHEPSCAVLDALENHYIAASRYNSYLSIIDDASEKKYR